MCESIQFFAEKKLVIALTSKQSVARDELFLKRPLSGRFPIARLTVAADAFSQMWKCVQFRTTGKVECK